MFYISTAIFSFASNPSSSLPYNFPNLGYPAVHFSSKCEDLLLTQLLNCVNFHKMDSVEINMIVRKIISSAVHWESEKSVLSVISHPHLNHLSLFFSEYTQIYKLVLILFTILIVISYVQLMIWQECLCLSIAWSGNLYFVSNRDLLAVDINCCAGKFWTFSIQWKIQAIKLDFGSKQKPSMLVSFIFCLEIELQITLEKLHSLYLLFPSTMVTLHILDPSSSKQPARLEHFKLLVTSSNGEGKKEIDHPWFMQ